MNEGIVDEYIIETACKDRFAVSLTIADVIVRNVPVAVATRATVFVTTAKQIYVLIAGQSSLVLDDMRKIIARMQLEAELYLPPYGEPEYFERIGRQKFKTMFPGKAIIGEEDLRYYKNLAPYHPALVRLSKIKGEIRGFEVESKTWRKVKDYSYAKIKAT